MNILAIGDYPHDLEYGYAGTLIRHVQNGDDVFLMVITEGGKGGANELRKQEQLDAARVIGAKDVFLGDYPDTSFECNSESIMKIEKVVEGVEAQVVYTHYGEDTHQDHRSIAQAVVPAAQSVPNLLYFEGLSSHGFNPTVFVNIRTVINQKLSALEARTSQVKKPISKHVHRPHCSINGQF